MLKQCSSSSPLYLSKCTQLHSITEQDSINWTVFKGSLVLSKSWGAEVTYSIQQAE